jgi:hypothetical protein
MKSDAVIYIYIYNNSLACFSRAESVGCSKNIFAVFAKKERTNFFLFFDLTNRQTKRKDRPNRFSLHSFTRTKEEAFRLKHHFIIESEHFPRAHVLLSSERSASQQRARIKRALFSSLSFTK